MNVIWLIVAFFLGSLITSLVYSIIRVSGTLKIDHSNPERDVYRFVIDDLDKLKKKSRIVLRIDHKANLSQK